MMKRRLAIVTSVAAVAVAVGATPAAAHPNHPPHNPAWCGAENMRAATTHMRDAMVLHTAPQGDAGMMGAVENGTYCRFRGSFQRPGRGGQRPLSDSMASAMTACCEW